MRVLLLALVSIFYIDHLVYAQGITQTTTSDIVDILSLSPDLNINLSKELSHLEDLNHSSSCSMAEEAPSNCQGLADSLLPENYKKSQWQTIFEIKYASRGKEESRSTANSTYQSLNFDLYRNWKDYPETEIKTEEDLNREVEKILIWYQEELDQTLDSFDIKTQLILDQLNNQEYFKNFTTLEQKNQHMFEKLKEYSKTLTDEEYLRFTTAMAGYVDYNKQRSNFIQKDGAGLGIITPFEQITKTGAGVCGDIHGMVARMGELKGWEAFTVGYAIEDVQHVVTAMIDPKSPDKLMIVNYGRYEEVDLKNANWVNPTATSGNGWQDVGTQLRIFKNSKTGDPMGIMNQIAAIPTPLGSFMTDLFKKENQISKAMPNHDNYDLKKVDFQNSKEKIKLTNAGNKIVDKLINKDIMIYEGKVENAHIFGVALSHSSFKDVYQYDEKEGKCVKKKSKYFSVGLANNLIDFPIAKLEETFMVYLNIKGGQVLDLYETDYFKFMGMIGYELDAFVSTDNGKFLSADFGFSSIIGFMADYNKNGTKIHTAFSIESTPGLQDQNRMTDLGRIKNIAPLAGNAIKIEADLNQKTKNPNIDIFSGFKGTTTRVGSQILVYTGILINNKFSLSASYQKSPKTHFPYKRGLKEINLLPKQDVDGLRLTAGYRYTNPYAKLEFSGYMGLSEQTKLNGGISIKGTIPHKKKKLPPNQ